MFVRRKHNKSGTTSIQVLAKIDGKSRVQKSFGCSRDEATLTALEREARQWAAERETGEGLFPSDKAAEYDAIFAGIGQKQLVLVGPELIYGRLFMIERAFRFCKTDLGIRPMSHRLINRIETHGCICFVACTLMLEPERIGKTAGSKITLERTCFLAERIYQITYVNLYDMKRMSVLLHNKKMPEITELLGIISANC